MPPDRSLPHDYDTSASVHLALVSAPREAGAPNAGRGDAPHAPSPSVSTRTSGKRCPDKQRYPGELKAMIALSHMRREGRSEKRVYRCNYCRGWHTTGKPRRMPPAGTWPDAPAGIA